MNSTLSCLTTWMPQQRWYSAKGRTPSLRIVASWDLPGPSPDLAAAGSVRVRTLLVADDSTAPVTLYQVPVVARATDSVIESDHVIGSPEPGTTLVDGPFDPAYTDALLRLVTQGGDAVGDGASARGIPSATAPDPHGYRSAVLSGEQSNTSIVYRRDDDAAPIICKVFRQLHPGLNPDIELQTALADSGSPFVPGAVGSVSGSWPDPAGGLGVEEPTVEGSEAPAVEGSLAFAQEFLPGVEDARRVAMRAAAEGEDFTARARELGVATADVHVSLARLFGTEAATPQARDDQAASWRRRLQLAIAEVPQLAEARGAIAAVYARAAEGSWPSFQRIHGDYHLGQVILVPERGWVLLDFEGEPIRPMDERVRPDLAIRDVAGMLRSFDYIAGSIRLEDPSRAGDAVGAGDSDGSADAVDAWARAARQSFLDGYAATSGVDLTEHGALLDALELDKAVYEALYEVRNRPDWITIPLHAIDRLLPH